MHGKNVGSNSEIISGIAYRRVKSFYLFAKFEFVHQNILTIFYDKIFKFIDV